MAGNSPLSTSAARRARSCRDTPAYAPALSHATLLLAPEAVRGWHAAKLVLTALWSRLLSLRICFVRRRSPDPGRTGLRGAWFKPRSGGSSYPGGVSPRPPRWHDQIPCLVPPHGQFLSDSVRLQVRILRLFDQTTPNIAEELYRSSFRSKGRDESVNDLVPHARQSF